jgi:hypothetical protein
MSSPLRPSGPRIPGDQERKIPLEDFKALLLPSGISSPGKSVRPIPGLVGSGTPKVLLALAIVSRLSSHQRIAEEVSRPQTLIL